MRLDKYLADMGAGTRSELKKEIRRGSASVDGVVIKDPGFSVDASSRVTYKGTPVVYEEFVYYMMNKPAGVISASDDTRESTVIDLITDESKRKDLFPAGRLDRDTEGLLLITNDGALAHRLLSPKSHVDKTYYVEVSGLLTAADADAFAEGLVLPDGLVCMPADLKILSVSEAPDPSPASASQTAALTPESAVLPSGSAVNDRAGYSVAEITIREGKFHQVKRMFAATGKEVTYLKRLSMGPLTLDPALAPGEYRRLTAGELESLGL